MRLSKRKWTFFLLIVVVLLVVISFIRLISDNETLNPLVDSLKFDVAELVSSLLAEGVFKSNRATVGPWQIPTVPVNDFPFTFRPHRREKCISETFVLLIKSGLKHFHNRQIMRNHFSRYRPNMKSSFEWFFFVGIEETGKGSTKNVVLEEQKNNSDLIVVNFVDTYINNTLKLMSEIYWLKDNLCQVVKWKQRFIFMDDDVFINLKQIEMLLSTEFEKPAIYGHKTENASPFRWRWSKWYISREQYVSNRYPPYVSGSTIVTNREALLKICLVIPYVKYFPFDDVFLGIVAELVGVEVINENRILIDYKCGLFCYEDVDKSIAIHVPNYLSKLEELYNNNIKTFF